MDVDRSGLGVAGDVRQRLPGRGDELIGDLVGDERVDGTLDLHQFAPAETKAATLEYIAVCLERRIMSIRIIHGKGTGVLRAAVRKELSKHPLVKSFREGESSEGGDGVTVATMAGQ